jgi:tRNA-binding protein
VMDNKPLCSYAEFTALDLRVGTVVKAQVFEGARNPAYQLWIDFGPLGQKKSSAQITACYTPDELIGQQVIAVINFPPKQIGSFMSECLVLGSVSDQQVVLLQPQQTVANGLPIA